MHQRTQNSGAPLAIEVSDLRLTLAGVPILQGVNLKVPAGRLVALIGPNGAGKTTLLRCMLGLQRGYSGQVKLFGEKQIQRALPRVGYVPQRLNLERTFVLSVREFLCLRLPQTRSWFWRSHRTNDVALRASLADIGVESLLDRPLANLSGGELQRVLIAYSLLTNPDLLLLDEPTAGVDLPGEQTFYDLIGEIHKKRGITVVLVSHDLSMVYRHADWIYALNGVVCCEGPPETIMNADSRSEERRVGKGCRSRWA